MNDQNPNNQLSPTVNRSEVKTGYDVSPGDIAALSKVAGVEAPSVLNDATPMAELPHDGSTVPASNIKSDLDQAFSKGPDALTEAGQTLNQPMEQLANGSHTLQQPADRGEKTSYGVTPGQFEAQPSDPNESTH